MSISCEQAASLVFFESDTPHDTWVDYSCRSKPIARSRRKKRTVTENGFHRRDEVTRGARFHNEAGCSRLLDSCRQIPRFVHREN